MNRICVFFLALAAMVLSLAAPAPAPAAVPDATFTILAGDVLQITVWKEEGMDREVLVLPDGTISFPLVGTLTVQNMTPDAVQALLKHRLGNIIPDAAVTVTVKAPLGHKISVLGQVQKPGEVLMSARTSVMQALSQAGGLTPYADEGGIVIIRPKPDGRGKETIAYPYRDIAAGRDLDKDIDLKPNDVVFVPTMGIF